MTYRGHVTNGAVTLDEGQADLPEGSEVLISVIPEKVPEGLHAEIVRMTGILPADLDVREDYYAALLEKHK